MMNSGIHTYRNGVRCWEHSIFPSALERCRQKMNLHEPLQEVIFKNILQRRDIRSYVNAGVGWGYYLLLARRLRPDLSIIGVEGAENMIRATHDNFFLNEVSNIKLIQSWVGKPSRADAHSLDDLLQHVKLAPSCLLSADIQGAAAAMLKDAPKTRRRISEMLISTHEGEHWECLELLKQDGRWLIRLSVEPGQLPLQPEGLVWATRIPIGEGFPWPEKPISSPTVEPWQEAATKSPNSFSASGSHYFLAQNQYGRYCIPVEYKKQSEAKKLIQGEVWEEETVQFMCQHAGDGDIVHAGTSFGDMLPSLSSACCAKGVVWAFEPNTFSHTAAKMTLQINQTTNVILIHSAVGEAEHVTDILMRDTSGHNIAGLSRIEPAQNHPRHLTESVRVMALDQTIPTHRRVSLIHLDVEGYELQALQGGRSIIRTHRPLLVIETVPKHPWFEQVILKELGYRVLRKVDGNTVFNCERPK